MKKTVFLAIFCLFFAACNETGPKKTLNAVANALSSNSPADFFNEIDMKAYAGNQVKNLTATDGALRSLNALGNVLGLGSIDNLLGDLVDMEGTLKQQFETGVASGELMAQCQKQDTPDCPWIPQSLKDAAVVELDANAAIAKVTTPAKLTSWLALHKIDGKWKIVGQAVLESRASAYAKKIPGKENIEQKQAPSSKKPAEGEVKI